jgi:hypothetical protein
VLNRSNKGFENHKQSESAYSYKDDIKKVARKDLEEYVENLRDLRDRIRQGEKLKSTDQKLINATE